MADSGRNLTSFVSWAHSDQTWQKTIATFVFALRKVGITADVDLFHLQQPGIDWTTYGPNAIRDSDTIIIATSAAYKERWENQRESRLGAGAAREAAVLKDLIDRDQTTFYKKVVVVLLPGTSVDDVPAELASGLPRFKITGFDLSDLEDLLRRLTGQPLYVPPPVGSVPFLPDVMVSPEVEQNISDLRPQVVQPLAEQLISLDDQLSNPATLPSQKRATLEAEQVTVTAAIDASKTSTRPPPDTAARRHRTEPQVATLIGCTMGRRGVYCGAVEVRVSTNMPSAADIHLSRERKGSLLPTQQKGSDEALYNAVTAEIIQCVKDLVLKQHSAQVATIGIGTPGIVDIRTGRLQLSVTVPENSDVSYEIGQRLIDREPDLIEGVFGVSRRDPTELSRRVLLDNDVRCVARHYLATQEWRNFACVYIGGGVGSALVVDREIYYGSSGSAGHIGHMQLRHPAPGWPDGARCLEPLECACGITGYHFDAMANFSGLELIADTLADTSAAALLSRIRSACQQEGIGVDDFPREGLMLLLGRDLSGVPPGVKQMLAGRDDFDEYRKRVLKAYAGVLSAGIATLTEVFDPGTVVLCGPIIEALRAPDFQGNLRQFIKEEIFYNRSAPQITVAGDVRDALWKGAALLPCERGYPAPIGGHLDEVSA